MSSPKRHHYVPQFLLERWCSPNGRLPGFRRNDDGSISCLNVLPKETAAEGHLYALDHVPEELRQAIETGFFRDHIDTPASKVLSRILSGGVAALSIEDREIWSRFLIASRARTPEWVRAMRQEGRARAEKSLLEGQDEFLAIKGDVPEETLLEWSQKHAPARVANAGIAILPDLICNPRRISQLASMPWAVFELSDATVPVLISDRPAIVTAGIDSPKFAFALPIGPSQLFVAAGRPEILEAWSRMPSSRLARLANESTVTIARRCVYGTAHPGFIRKRLGAAFVHDPDARR